MGQIIIQNLFILVYEDNYILVYAILTVSVSEVVHIPR